MEGQRARWTRKRARRPTRAVDLCLRDLRHKIRVGHALHVIFDTLSNRFDGRRIVRIEPLFRNERTDSRGQKTQLVVLGKWTHRRAIYGQRRLPRCRRTRTPLKWISTPAPCSWRAGAHSRIVTVCPAFETRIARAGPVILALMRRTSSSFMLAISCNSEVPMWRRSG